MVKLIVYAAMCFGSLKLTDRAVDDDCNRLKFSGAATLAWLATMAFGLML